MCSILQYVYIVSTQHELILSIYNLDLSREHNWSARLRYCIHILYGAIPKDYTGAVWYGGISVIHIKANPHP